jgi:hypothetical protein
LLPGVVDDPLSHLLVDLVDLRHLIVECKEKEECLGHIWFGLEICLQEGLKVAQFFALFLDPGQDLLLDHERIVFLCGPSMGIALEGGIIFAIYLGSSRRVTILWGRGGGFFRCEGFFGFYALAKTIVFGTAALLNAVEMHVIL